MGGGSEVVRFLGTDVSDAQMATVRGVVREYPGLSRAEIAATVCELLGWTRASGRPKTRECFEWLEKLEGDGHVRLPQKRSGRPRGSKTSIPPPAAGDEREAVTGEARDVGPIRLERVCQSASRLRFRELVGHYHYLGYRVPYGAQLRYMVRSGRGEILGCLQFTSAAWRLAPRERWIGWDDARRKRLLVQVVCNSRFLILPWVRVRNLATTILARAMREMPRDWREVYGVEPLLCETFVDERRFLGTCYRAANWIDLGITTGRGRMDRYTERTGKDPKRIFVYPLRRDSRQRLMEG